MNYIIPIVDTFFFIGSVVNALLFLPQAYKIFKAKHAKDVSLPTFLGFNLIQIITGAHGALYHDTILVIGTILNFIACFLVTSLIFYYKDR